MKKNIKVIIGIVIGMLLVSGISVYATLSFTAGDIEYTKSGTNTKISVANALNELYQNKKETTDNVQSITQNGSVQLDKYYKNLNVNVPIPAGYVSPSGTKTISTKANNIDVKNYQYADTTGMYTADEYNAKTGEGEYWRKISDTLPSGGTLKSKSIACGFNNPSQIIIEFKDDVSNIRIIRINAVNKFYGINISVNDLFDCSSFCSFSNGVLTLHDWANNFNGVDFDVYFLK